MGSAPAIGPDGTIYVNSVDHTLYAITPAGTLRWRYQTPGFIIDVASSPAIGRDGTIYVGHGFGPGSVVALNPDGTPR